MLLGYTSPKRSSLFYRWVSKFLHLAQNSRWRLDEWHHNVNIYSYMPSTFKTKERVGVWRIFFVLWFFFMFFMVFLCFLKSISITKTVRMNRTLACFQKNEIISNFSGIYFWPLPFRVGSEFDKISGWVGCRIGSIPILPSHP